jgi:hypothetical protein
MSYSYTRATAKVGAAVRHPLFCAEYGVGEILQIQNRDTANGGTQAFCRFPGTAKAPGIKEMWLKLSELRCPGVMTRRIDNLRRTT